MLIRFKGIVNISDGQYFSAMEICIFSKQKQSSGKNAESRARAYKSLNSEFLTFFS